MEHLVHRYWRRTWTIQWLMLMALWFAFVWKVEAGEAVFGIAGAAIAASADVGIRRRRRFAKFRPAPRWLIEFWREPGYVVSGSPIIFWVLLRRLILRKEPDSVFRSIPFDASGSTPRAAARRALALVLTTIPPNFIVIGIDENKGAMLVHQVQESGVPEVTKR